MYQTNREEIENNKFWDRKTGSGAMSFMRPTHKDRLEESEEKGVFILNKNDSEDLDRIKSLILRMNEYAEAKEGEIRKLTKTKVAGMIKDIMRQTKPNKTFKPWGVHADVATEGVGLKNLWITVDQEEGGVLADFKVYILSKNEKDLEHKMSEHFWADMFLNNRSPFYEQKLVERVLEKEALDGMHKACEKLLETHDTLKSFLREVVSRMS